MQPNPALIAVLTTLLIVLRGWVAAMELASLTPGNPHDAEKRQGLEAAIRIAERLLAAIEAQRNACPAPAATHPRPRPLPCTAHARRRTAAAARPAPQNPTAWTNVVATIRRAIPIQGTGPPPHPA